MGKTAIVMFAKAPVAGAVKTRLGASISNTWSAQFHAAFIADLSQTIVTSELEPILCYAGDRNHVGFDVCRTLGFRFIEQPEGDLGVRLSQISFELFKEFEKIIIIGSDSPTLQLQHFIDADACLESADIVLGPSFDGGYYLIGLNRSGFLDDTIHEINSGVLSVFREINWSTPTVFAETLNRCREEQHRCQLLGFWYDVDTVVDLQFMFEHLNHLRDEDIGFGVYTHMLFEEFKFPEI